METASYKIADWPKHEWRLEITQHFHIHQQKAPNWFHRKMQYWLLGWKWEKLNPQPVRA